MPISSPSRSRFRGWVGFIVCLATIGIIWLGLLPYLGEEQIVAEHIAVQKQRGIDPSAMFYSELKISPPIAHRVERLQRSDYDAFWTFSGGVDR